MKMYKTISLFMALALMALLFTGCQSLPDPTETVGAFWEGVKAYDYEAIAATLGAETTVEDIQTAIGSDLNRSMLGPVYSKISYQCGEPEIDSDARTATVPVEVTYPDLGAIFTSAYESVLEPLVNKALEGETTSQQEVEKLLMEGVVSEIEAEGAPMRTDSLSIDLVYADETGWGILVSEELVGVLTGQINEAFGEDAETSQS